MNENGWETSKNQWFSIIRWVACPSIWSLTTIARTLPVSSYLFQLCLGMLGHLWVTLSFLFLIFLTDPRPPICTWLEYLLWVKLRWVLVLAPARVLQISWLASTRDFFLSKYWQVMKLVFFLSFSSFFLPLERYTIYGQHSRGMVLFTRRVGGKYFGLAVVFLL